MRKDASKALWVSILLPASAVLLSVSCQESSDSEPATGTCRFTDIGDINEVTVSLQDPSSAEQQVSPWFDYRYEDTTVNASGFMGPMPASGLALLDNEVVVVVVPRGIATRISAGGCALNEELSVVAIEDPTRLADGSAVIITTDDESLVAPYPAASSGLQIVPLEGR